ncbi:MAG TPA: ferritin-like domain-containing protein [Rhodocyclaceae bacterium]|nr:ferritin-like domain-containing protein [Rhodocyclaceae bacterium]
MNNRINPFAPLETLTRRRFLAGSGAVLSAGAVALLAGRPALADQHRSQGGDAEADARILNTALGAELEAIAAYGVGAASGLLRKPALNLAVQFQGHHKAHADLLAATIGKLGGSPVEARSQYEFPTEQLKAEADVLRFAAALERGAVSAYLGAVPLFGERELAKAAASILGDEAMHWAVLRYVLGEDPVPAAFVS